MPLDFSQHGTLVATAPDFSGGSTPVAEASPDKEESVWGDVKAAAKHFAAGVIPSAGGLAGASAAMAAAAPVAAMTGPFAPIVEGGAALLGGLGAGYLTGKAQEAVLPDAVNQDLAEEAAAHPKSAFLGGVASALPTMGVGMVRNAAGKISAASHAVAGAAGGGLEAGRELVTGEELDPFKIGAATVAGTALTKPTAIGKKIAPKFAETPTAKPKDTPNPEDLVKDFTKSKTTTPTTTPTKGEVDPNAPLASTDDKGEITLNHPAIEQDFNAGFPYMFDPSSPTGQQKQSVFADMGITPEQFKEKIPDVEAYKAFLEGHEASHVANNDHPNYPRKSVENTEAIARVDKLEADGSLAPHEAELLREKYRGSKLDLEHPDALAIEKRATLDGLAAVDKHLMERTTAEVTTPKLPSNHNELADSLFTLDKMSDVDKIKANTLYRGMKEKGLDEHASEAIRAHVEQSTPLSTEHQHLYDTYVKPLKEHIDRMSRELISRGVMEPAEMGDKHLSRMTRMKNPDGWAKIQQEIDAKNGVPPKSTTEKIKAALGDWASGDQGGFDLNIQRTRNAAKQRSLFSFVDENGKRSVIQFTGNKVLFWRKGRVVRTETIAKGDTHLKEGGGLIKAGDEILGGQVVEATKKELEYHSPFEYVNDLGAVMLQRSNELTQMVRAHRTIDALKDTAFFKENSVKLKEGEMPPEGWAIPKHTDKLPQFRDVAFPKRVADVISDYAKVTDPTLLTNLSGVIVKNMMLNPLPHMWNEAAHLYLARGASGWFTPQGMVRWLGTTKQAIRSVLNQDEVYQQMIKEGASMLAPSARQANKEIDAALFKAVPVSPALDGMVRRIAKSTGRSVKDTYNAISAKSSEAMWTVRDVMYQSYVRELMKQRKLDLPSAIKEAERHMPNYRLPTHVGEGVLGEQLSRGLSVAMQNPNLTVFSRYHHGLVKSILETNKDLVSGMSKKHRESGEWKSRTAHAADTYAALGIAMGILYPLTDACLAAVSGNEEAHQRRSGPFHLLASILDVHEGTKDPQAILASLFTTNPALLSMVQLAADRTFYNGRPIYHADDPIDVIAGDIAGYIVKQLPLASSVMTSASDKGGGAGQWVGKQFDVELPSEEQARRRERMIKKAESEARNRATRREYD